MDEPSLKKLIHELLAEALGATWPDAGAFAATTPVPQVCVETVSIDSDRELMAFVQHVLELARDGRTRAEIESRRRVFRLAGRSPAAAPATGAMRSPAMGEADVSPARFEQGLVTERSVDAITAGTTRLILGKRARLTPLARDRARQRGMKIERAGR
ncbi:MAG: hypothetical protein EPN72_07130 [Nevskiaceae bacterium]|nr:MAG: hypothetical protein EPN63_10830 [Nevskiaceae bacterium]TBR73265.1 MAG: hypothetical protein EPN72_07130 [Nevskiaceae bacterium]